MTLRWQDGDRIYERLTEVTDGMDDHVELGSFLARLVFLLANEIGDADTVLSAIDAALTAAPRDG